MLKYCKTHDVIKLIVVERKLLTNGDHISTDAWIYLQIYDVARVSKSQSCAYIKAELLWIFANLSYKGSAINKRRYWWPLRDGKLINCLTRKIVCRLPISARNNGLSAKTNSFQFLLISATSSSFTHCTRPSSYPWLAKYSRAFSPARATSGFAARYPRSYISSAEAGLTAHWISLAAKAFCELPIIFL